MEKEGIFEIQDPLKLIYTYIVFMYILYEKRKKTFLKRKTHKTGFGNTVAGWTPQGDTGNEKKCGPLHHSADEADPPDVFSCVENSIYSLDISP